MIRLGKALTLVSLLCATIFSGHVVARRRETFSRQVGEDNHARRATGALTPGVKNITFTNPLASGTYSRVHVSLTFFFSHCVQSSTWMVKAFPM